MSIVLISLNPTSFVDYIVFTLLKTYKYDQITVGAHEIVESSFGFFLARIDITRYIVGSQAMSVNQVASE